MYSASPDELPRSGDERVIDGPPQRIGGDQASSLQQERLALVLVSGVLPTEVTDLTASQYTLPARQVTRHRR